jgi:hypothetical protein
MKNKLLILSLFIIALITFGCTSSEDDSEISKEGGPFEISELAGNWEATSASFWRATDGLLEELVADGGSVSLTVQSNGSCTFTIDPFDSEAYTVSGKMFWGSFEGEDALAIVWDDNPNDRSYFRWIELTATTFDMGCTSECAEYDFNNNGTSETADLGFEFIRN